MLIGAIWAQTREGVIGAGNTLPWHLPEDLKHFSQITKGSAVIMGRNTWESLPEKFRPLPDRENLVITSSSIDDEAVTTFDSLEAALDYAHSDGYESVWVIGGGQLYAAALKYVAVVERTIIDARVDGDTFAPDLATPVFSMSKMGPSLKSASSYLSYRFETLHRHSWDWSAMKYRS